MGKWKTKCWHIGDDSTTTVESFLNQLTDEQFKSVAKEMKLLELCGNTLKMPHSKALGSSIFELRERKFGYRIYYTFGKNNLIILLNAGDKSSQKKDIKIARQRLVEILKEAQESRK